MTFCKIIQNDTIVSVGCVFLKWNTKRNRLFVCDDAEGQFIQSYDERHIYKAAWMKPSKEAKCEYEDADVVVITETEYNDIKEQLNEGEPIIEEVQERPLTIEHHEEPDEEKPLSIAEMRELIKTQQSQIELLMSKLT